MLVISLYEVGSTFVAPQSLTADEAVDLHRSGVLQAADFGDLTQEAQFAIALEVEAKLHESRPRKGTTVIRWGVKRLTRAFIGRA